MVTTETDRINKNGNFDLTLIPYETNTPCPPKWKEET
jgi:hypothetical protein